MNRIEKEVRSLKGGLIEEALVVDGTPLLILTMPSGARVQIEAWQDPEGNGPGFLSIGPTVVDRGNRYPKSDGR